MATRIEKILATSALIMTSAFISVIAHISSHDRLNKLVDGSAQERSAQQQQVANLKKSVDKNMRIVKTLEELELQAQKAASQDIYSLDGVRNRAHIVKQIIEIDEQSPLEKDQDLCNLLDESARVWGLAEVSKDQQSKNAALSVSQKLIKRAANRAQILTLLYRAIVETLQGTERSINQI